jgi:hypothetical protein
MRWLVKGDSEELRIHLLRLVALSAFSDSKKPGQAASADLSIFAELRLRLRVSEHARFHGRFNEKKHLTSHKQGIYCTSTTSTAE